MREDQLTALKPSYFYFEKHIGFDNYTILETAEHYAFKMCEEFNYKQFQNFSITIGKNQRFYRFNFKVTREPFGTCSHEIRLLSKGVKNEK